IRSGASGFLVKDTEPVELLRAVRAVAAGDALLSPSVTRRLIGAFATQSRAPRHPALDTLTDREREVMVLVAEGLSNDEIAERLVVSPMTAKTHVSRAMTKLGARDRAQLVVFAYESGLVRPGWSARPDGGGWAAAARARTGPGVGGDHPPGNDGRGCRADDRGMTTTPTATSTDVRTRLAAQAVEATKVYGSGPTAVMALDAVTVGFEAGRFTAIM